MSKPLRTLKKTREKPLITDEELTSIKGAMLQYLDKIISEMQMAYFYSTVKDYENSEGLFFMALGRLYILKSIIVGEDIKKSLGIIEDPPETPKSTSSVDPDSTAVYEKSTKPDPMYA